jgi:putative ATP-dependent endonuclease of the OLD family
VKRDPPADDAPTIAGETSEHHGSANQVLGQKGLDPTTTYIPSQLALFDQYRSLFQMGSKPAAHLVALSNLTDEQLLDGLPPVMQRLIARASHPLTLHGE